MEIYKEQLIKLAKKFENADTRINWSRFESNRYQFIVFSKSEFDDKKGNGKTLNEFGHCIVTITELEAKYAFDNPISNNPEKFIEQKFAKTVANFEKENQKFLPMNLSV